MTGERGTTCPECGTPRGPDNTPSCDCTARASEALRETRTAEAAAAEDFDPLRIRPYVEVGPVPEEPPPAPPAGTAPPPHPETRAPLGPVAEPDAPTAGAPAGRPQRRSRRRVLLAAGGAGAAVVAVAGVALFSYRAPARERAAQEVRESIPETTTRAPSSATATATATAPAPPVTPRPPRPSPSATADPSPSQGSASPSPTPTASASASRAAASPVPSTTPSGTPDAPGTTPAAPPALRRGDTGPEVTELQQRLRELNLYGDQVDGVFTRRVEDAVRNYQFARGIRGDGWGTYGPATRRSLESETTEP
ncbi:peptidoglycan-binding domain-containing protein [Streptomyces flaveolus]|uniref:peptidoglycan-binding domain-containing protein n=1 Tax=Streptomyces flaveolus TaxID=67297 RepID=UPI0033B82ECB